MITKTEWQTVNEELMAEERRRLGEPPTREELDAYTRGELTPEQEERVRERLACDPELARTLVAPFPQDEPRPGDPDYVTDAHMAQRWEALQKRMAKPAAASTGRVLPFQRAITALAAALAVVFAGLWFKAQSELRTPRVITQSYLQAGEEGIRGAGGGVVTARRGDQMLVTPRVVSADFTEFRLEIWQGGDRLWESGPVRPVREDFSVYVPSAFLKPGEYEVVVRGINLPPEEKLATYRLRVTE